MFNDLSYAMRLLLKSPRFVLVVVFSLAVGMAVNTAVFTLLDVLVLKPLPSARTEGLVFLLNSSPERQYGNNSYPQYRAYAERNDVFSGLMSYSARPLALTTNDGTEQINGEVVSENYFSVLEVIPSVGRFFPGDESRLASTAPVAVLSHDFWKRRYQSDPTLVGQTLIVNGHSFTVVGIAPSEFSGLGWPVKTDVWVQAEVWAIMVREPDRITDWGHSWIDVMGRLKPNVTREQAEAAMTSIAQGLPSQPGVTPSTETRVILSNVSDGHPGARSEMLEAVLPIAGAGFLVGTLILLIGCANAASLLLARAASRGKEVAIRMALGGSRGRLVRLFLMESLVLASLAGIAGLILSVWGLDLLLKIKPPIPMPELSIDLRPDLRVFGFTFVVSLVTGALFGLTPALRATGTSLTAALNEQRRIIGRGAVKFTVRNILVVSQVAMSLLLLITAGLFARSLQKAHSIDPGFDFGNVYLLSLDSEQLGMNVSKPPGFDEQVLERVRRIPGVESATLVDPVPLSLGGKIAYFQIEGSDNPEGQPISHTHIAPDYFKTLRIGLVKGRDFVDQDSTSSLKVGIINETMAARYWPGQHLGELSPLGRRIINNGQAIEIVGIARDTKHRYLGESPEPWLYIPIKQNTTSNKMRPTLMVRGITERGVAVAALRKEISLLAPNWPVFEVKSMTESMGIQFFVPQLAAAILGSLGTLGLLLAIVGIYGLVSYSVAQRTHEIGIRMALGARSTDVMRLVISQSLTLTLVGVVAGGAIAAGVTRFLSSLLIGISPTDPLTFALVSVTLVASATVASIFPARRALRVNPIEALRCE